MHDALIYELHITTSSPDQIDPLIGICSFLEVEALEERTDKLIIYSEDQTYLLELRTQLLSYASWLSDEHIILHERANENWNQLWESSFQPIIIDDFCIIKSSKHDNPAETKYTIIIDPEMAFGTGHHETTYMMIEVMKHLNFQRQNVLDYGSGTAILSILAEKLGATKITAIDYDEQATRCALKCLEQNSSEYIQCLTGTIEELQKDDPYDIILANINRNVLLSSANKIAVSYTHLTLPTKRIV